MQVASWDMANAVIKPGQTQPKPKVSCWQGVEAGLFEECNKRSVTSFQIICFAQSFSWAHANCQGFFLILGVPAFGVTQWMGGICNWLPVHVRVLLEKHCSQTIGWSISANFCVALWVIKGQDCRFVSYCLTPPPPPPPPPTPKVSPTPRMTCRWKTTTCLMSWGRTATQWPSGTLPANHHANAWRTPRDHHLRRGRPPQWCYHTQHV